MKKRSLRFKLLTGGILIVLLPLMVVGIFSAYKSTRALEAMAFDHAASTAKNLAEMVQTAMTDEVKLITVLAADFSKTAAGDYGAVSARLAAMMEKIGQGYEGIFVTDTSGVIKADGDSKSIGLNLGERDYFKQGKEGKITIGKAVKSKKTGLPIVVVSAPIMKDGAFNGIVAVAMKTDALAEKIAAVKIGKTGYAFMVDKTGMAITHPKKELVIDATLDQFKGMESITKKTLAHQTGAEGYVFNGSRKIAGFAPVPISGWAIIATQDESEFLASALMIRNVIILTAVIFLVLTIIGLLFFARSITLPIGKATSKLTSASAMVASASDEVSSASQSLAEGASEQASALEETSSSLEEMSSMTKQNAGNAGQADGLMKEANRIVKNANEAMTELTRSMSDISTASEETSKIIKTIDEIAFQTNLLALNAAVEAARAGEAGAGFAVVADEVRNLAMRAAEAARNTSTLIEDTVHKIQTGSALVGRTSTAFSEVSISVSKVGELVAEIAAASQEQSSGIDQINKAVAEMDKVIQRTAASAEESAAAAEEMNAQAQEMRQVTGELRDIVGGEDGAVAADLETAGGTARKAGILGRGQKKLQEPTL